MNDTISVLITAHNEDLNEVNNTIASIRATAGDIEIVLVDDASVLPLDIKDKSVNLIRTDIRCGVGPARHCAALHATGEYLLITDAHCRFEKGWSDRAMKRIVGRPTTVHCGSCVALEVGQMDMAKATHTYHGATLNVFGPDKNKPGATQILEGNWLSDREGDDYPIACIMGAVYLMPTDWFFHLNGLRMLKGWGGDEVLLSLKSWLAGGECRMMKSVRIGHQFRHTAPYPTEAWALKYNAMMIALTCLPMDKAWKLNSLHRGGPELLQAKKEIERDYGNIMAERFYLQSIFKRDFQWYLDWFHLTFPQ